MAHRGTASNKKADLLGPAFASVTAADIIRAPVEQKAIPLDLASLLAPYKRQGRLTLRVERMPQRAKLSAGRNNGDGSWSLASDELEDLNYLVPSNLCGGHELAVRIMSFDNAAAHTLKVIPLAIPSWNNEADEPGKDNIVRSLAQGNDPILHNELSKMQSLFAVRDSDLAELRVALKQANAQKESELAAARTEWEAELGQHLAAAAALAKSEREQERLAWQNERQGQTNQTEALIQDKFAQELARSKVEADQFLEAERKRWQVQAEQAVADERSRLKAEIEQRIEAERKQWRGQSEQTFAEDRSRLKAEIDQQLEAGRKQWQTQMEQAVAQERSRLKAEIDQQLEAERRRWQAQAERMVAEERERLKSETGQQLEAERQQWQVQTERMVAEERERLKSETGQQLEAERQHWRAQGEQQIAQERARATADADQRVEAERLRWQAQVSDSGEAERHRLLIEADQRLGAEQKRWQEQSDDRVASERQRWENDSLAASSQAEARWKSEEAVRASTALAEWQQQTARLVSVESDKCRKLEAALAGALAQPSAAPVADGSEVERLRQELAALQSTLPEREREITQLRDEMNRQRARQDSEIAQAAQAGKAEDAARIEALVANARAQLQDAIAAATTRAENAERLLAEAQEAPAVEVPRWDDAYVDGLRRDISTLRAALVNREVELGHARAALDQARVHQVIQRPGNAPIRRFAGPNDEQEEAKDSVKPTFMRDFAIMVCVLVPVILAYPYLAGYLPDSVRSGISTVTGGLLSVRMEPAPAPRAAVALAPVAQRPRTSVTRTANVRDTPAAKGAILATLPRDFVVAVLTTTGNWTQIEFVNKGGKPQQGWVFNTYLKTAAQPAPVKPNNANVAAQPATAAAKPESATATVAPESASIAAKPEPASTATEPESAAAEPAK